MAHVFKIKFGDTLRRLNVPMRHDELTPGWTYSELEAKIRGLFSIPHASQLVITYKDADNDIVTMADNQDLMDACIVQRLNPIRLDVKAVPVPQPLQIPPSTIGIGPVTVEIPPAITIPPVITIPPAITAPPVKFIPPAVTIPPSISIAPMKLLTPAITIPPAITISPVKVETPAITIPPWTEFSVENLLKWILPESTLQATRNILDHYPPYLFTTVPARVLLEALETFLKNLTGYGVMLPTGQQQATSTASNLNQDRASAVPSPAVTEFSLENLLGGAFPDSTAEAIRQILNRYPPYLFAKVPAGVLPEALDGFLRNLTGYGATLPSEQPATLMESSFDPLQQTSAYQGGGSEKPGPGRQSNKPEAPPRILHEYVQCDGCGMQPIEGPRYKSMKKHDYDLCSSCFQDIGNGTDYHKIDRPTIRKTHCHFSPALRTEMEQQPKSLSPSRASFLQESHDLGPEMSSQNHSPDGLAGSENTNGKLDSQFVKDVTIFDGTELAPGTKFTKIWEMKNVGTLPWPQQTKLVHVGGDVITSSEFVSLELPEGGLPCGEKIYISVDLRAPENIGRHVSHWCLTVPSGQRFGHRVWVLIQVVPSGEELPQVQESVEGQSIGELVSIFEKSADVPDKVVADAESSLVVPLIDEIESAESSSSAGPMTDSEDQQGEDIDELDGFSVVENPLESNARSAESVVEYDFVELLDSEPAFETTPKENREGVPKLESGHVEESGFGKLASDGFGLGQKDMQAFLQEFALEKLKSMGFVQRDLNIELLQKNNCNLQQTMDDLVTLAKWDQILKDLEEMGFYDTQTNRRLLFKNEGSMKRVVKELVEIEKQMSRGKGKEKAA